VKLPRPTLAQALLAANLCLAALLGALLFGVFRGSEQAVFATSELVRRATSALVGQRIREHLDGAERTIAAVERRIQRGLCDPADPRSVEATLFAAVLDHPGLDALVLARGRALGFDAQGRMRLAPEGRSQVGVYRETPDPGSALVTDRVREEGGRFLRHERRRPRGGGLEAAPFARAVPPFVPDPTAHPLFVTAASRPRLGSARPVWSDLRFVEADLHLPERDRRVVVTATRGLEDAAGGFAGVLLLGLRAETVDRILWEVQERARPNRIVLCDREGRLLARLAPADAFREQPDASLRVEPRLVPPEIAAALGDESLRSVTGDADAHGRFLVAGRPFLVSFQALPVIPVWRVGVAVAEDELPGVAEQARLRKRLLAFALVVSAAILAGGVLTLRTVRRGLAGIRESAGRMRDFDFAPAAPRAFFRDLEDVKEGLELAKTAMRAMSKYVPVDVVRLLYRTGREPILGGELLDVSLLFTDIKDFTALSERLPPGELAQVLGLYLETVTTAVHGARGTIDKYIGDSVMAVWNAPSPCPDDARWACEAALRARAAAERLFASREWADRPPLVTRFGVHRAEVLVGHFGAPDRLSYTCLGDGVNLASRLEGLNKQYGTTVLVSEAVRRDAGDGFAFRLVDLVAVKGKREGVRIHELRGWAGEEGPEGAELVRRYEEAFRAYLGRDFGRALEILEAQPPDPPSVVLAERCRLLLAAPPGPRWNGVFVAASK